MNKQILKLAVPAIFNNITVPLLGLCDTTIAGHLGSASFLAAMAVGSMMLNVIFWLCGFLRMGTTGLTAQAYGASDGEAVDATMRRAVSLALIISIGVLALQYPLERALFLIIAPDGAVSESASLYFRICIWSTPAQLLIMVITGWFIGLQNTFIPMVIAVSINIINILLSLLLVFGFDCGFAGIAIGTLAANYLGLLLAFYFVRKQRRPKSSPSSLWAEPAALSPEAPAPSTRNEKPKTSNLLQINADLFFRSACIMGVTLAMTSYGSRIGETTLAANSIIMQFFLFFSYFMDGFAFAGEALVGKTFGAGEYRLMRRSVNRLLLWGAAMALLFCAVYILGVPSITRLLTDSAVVIDTVIEMQAWVVIVPPVTVAAFIFDGIFIGLARTRPLLVTTLIATAAFFIIVTLLGKDISNSVLWTAFLTYLLLRGVLLAADYVKLQSKLVNL